MNEMFKASKRFTFGNSHKNWPGSFYGKENKDLANTLVLFFVLLLSKSQFCQNYLLNYHPYEQMIVFFIESNKQ